MVDPDGFKYNDKNYKFDNKGCFPFFLFKDGTLKWGKESSAHAETLFEITKEMIFGKGYDNLTKEEMDTVKVEEEDNVRPTIEAEGRLYLQIPAITYWDGFFYNDKEYSIDDVRRMVSIILKNVSLDTSKLMVQLNSELVPYTDLFKDDASTEQGDIDLLKQNRAIHLMNQKDKRNAMKDYLDDRRQSIGNKLRYSSGNGEMSQAEWHNLHRIGDSKQYPKNKQIRETIELSFSDLKRIIESVVRKTVQLI